MDNVLAWLLIIGLLAAFKLISDAVCGLTLIVFDKIYPRTSFTLTYQDPASGVVLKKRFDRTQLNLFIEKYTEKSSNEANS